MLVMTLAAMFFAAEPETLEGIAIGAGTGAIFVSDLSWQARI